MELSRYAQFNDISQYVREVNTYPMLSPEEEKSLAVRYFKTGDLDAAKRLVTANLRFVIKVAYEYIHYGYSLLDLIQEGNLGLMMAVKKFDPFKNYKLISYAIWWIRAYIQNFIMDNYSLVKLGTTQNQRKLFYNLPKMKRELANTETSASDVNAEIAKLMDVSPVEVDEMELRLSSRDFSLEYSRPDSTESLIDSIPDYREGLAETYEEQDESARNRKNIIDALGKLSEKEQFIIEHRILNESPLTLQEVGEKLGITRERVRQIENNALQKLRKSLEAREY